MLLKESGENQEEVELSKSEKVIIGINNDF
jgi:hypothetical protein